MPDPQPNPAPAQDPTAHPTANPPKPADPAKPDPAPLAKPLEPKPDEPLGDAGLKALQEERKARQELEKQLKSLAPLQKVAEALGGGDPAKGKTEIEQLTDRISSHETELAKEREARWRAEVANDKGLSIEQATELHGTTREELAAHADKLTQLFAAAPDPSAPKTPKPDKSQGSRGSVDLDAQIADAEAKGDTRLSIRLKNQKAIAARAAGQ